MARRPSLRLPSLAATAVVAAVAAAAAAPPARAADAPPQAEHRLAAGEAVKIAVYGQNDLSGTYQVGLDGRIRLPLAGGIAVAGLDLAAAEAAIRERVAAVLEYAAPVTIDMAAYRPVFVVGAVTRPGQQAYQPGLQALQAYASAAGLSGASGGDQMIEILAARHKVRQFEAEVRDLLIRRATLEAALAGRSDILLPPELASEAATPAVQDLLLNQVAFLASEDVVMTNARSLTQRQIEQLDQEIAALAGEETALDTQRSLVVKELQKTQSLRNEGLTTSSRLLSLQQMRSDLEADRYRQAAYLSRARQEKIRVEEKLRTLEEDRRNTYLRETADVVRDLEIARAKLAAARDQALALGMIGAGAAVGGGAEPLTFTVSRVIDGRLTILEAGPETPLLPGDVLEVAAAPAALPPSAAGGGGGGAQAVACRVGADHHGPVLVCDPAVAPAGDLQ
ncbi:polysaccharide biosynthesis/export family protein [Caenispirillum bisanense]|uniref:Protein involved in polysaccharide export, contains SLBB domain of the beta-grasp fold n=1 Tax=Caenispirillum bisanense TaxID=414052 RepID=A0A286GE80_9PROT|nr:polysaccharide biosynthesis/export family protein [Caenispirillum bisanense]SOD93439.1 protein involved in polysaccharide export, contains SLBB domain of the beta-grasp fold [Caenispirillum bisanense]